MKYHCSRCGADIDGIIVKITTSYQVYKNTSEGLKEEYNNTSEATSEMLCPECFDKYCKCLDLLNKEYEGRYLTKMVEVVDDIQYDDHLS